MSDQWQVLVLVAILASCVTPPQRIVPQQYQKVIETNKPAEELYKAAIQGIFRIFKEPSASVEFSSDTVNLIIAEGYIKIEKMAEGSMGQMFPTYNRVWMRLIIDIKAGAVRLTVEDVHEVYITLGWDAPVLKHRHGVEDEWVPVWELAMKQNVDVLEAALTEPPW